MTTIWVLKGAKSPDGPWVTLMEWAGPAWSFTVDPAQFDWWERNYPHLRWGAKGEEDKWLPQAQGDQ